MLTLPQINEMNREAGALAKADATLPFVWPQDPELEDLASIPNLGEYVPCGWERRRNNHGYGISHFVDISGLGSEGELALTTEQLFAALTPGHAYAFIEVGQFQGYIGAFKCTKSKCEDCEYFDGCNIREVS